MLNAKTSKRLQTTQAQLQKISYDQEQNQEISYAQAQLQEISYAQAQHLIYNQWCSQNKSDKTLKTLEFLRYGSFLTNSK